MRYELKLVKSSQETVDRIIAYGGDHIRAMQPVSLISLRGWIIAQVPGVDDDNADRLLSYALVHWIASREFYVNFLYGYIDFA